MINETFYSDEFVTSQILNQDVQNNINNFQSLTLGRGLPGLIAPTAVSYSVSGLNVGLTMPAPFQVLFGTGILAGAHGTINGNDTQSYTASFSGVVPATGFPTVTAYLVCTYTQIQQNPIIFIGPPPGHPDYNPNYQPYTAYTQTVDSINVFATVSPPDNSTSFELFRCTLSSGATGLGTTTTAYQEWASSLDTLPVEIYASPGTLQAQAQNNIMVGGTYTLPNASSYNGNLLAITCNTAQLITVVSSSNNIFGYFAQGASPIQNFSLAQGASIELEAINGNWQIVGGNPLGLGIPSAPVYPYTVPEGGTGVEYFTPNAVVIGEGANPLSTVGPGAYGIPFLGGGSGAPFFSSLNIDSNAITGVLQFANGGTNQTSYAPWSTICLNSGTGQFWGVSPGVPGQAFISNGSTLPSYQALNIASASNVTGTLPITNGGTNNTGYAPFGTICFNSNTGQLFGQAPGPAGTVFTSNGNALPSFQGLPTSYNTEGYVILPGGMTIQWGQVIQTPVGYTTVVFPYTFPNVCYSVVLSDNNAETWSQNNMTFYGAGDINQAGFIVGTCNWNGSRINLNDGSRDFNWMAIGF